MTLIPLISFNYFIYFYSPCKILYDLSVRIIFIIISSISLFVHYNIIAICGVKPITVILNKLLQKAIQFTQTMTQVFHINYDIYEAKQSELTNKLHFI